MKCPVCNSLLYFYFSKEFGGEYGLKKVHYDECSDCGLVIARELFDMPLKEWERLNNDFHSSFLGKPDFELDPNWNKRILNQVNDIIELDKLGIIEASYGLDFACGDGRLISLLRERGSIYCMGYDRYTEFKNNCILLNNTFKLVINTSFFEHVRNRETLDKIDRLVAEDGVLALHTLVCEEVPKDPSWFYLVPVHSVVYTNRAMEILFKQWGYHCSIYNPDSRMWFWFKEVPAQDKIPDRFIYKDGFVDYWK